MSFELPQEQSVIEFGSERPKKDALGIIPLIDVAFFLLIFFMVAGTVERFDIIDIQPPAAQSGELLDEGHIVILLGTYNEIVMDDELITLEQMSSKLREILKLHPDKVITLKADADIPAVKMINVMDAIKASGGKQITIATKHEEGNL